MTTEHHNPSTPPLTDPRDHQLPRGVTPGMVAARRATLAANLDQANPSRVRLATRAPTGDEDRALTLWIKDTPTDVATAATLAAVAHTRATLAAQYPARYGPALDPAGRVTPESRRHEALSAALGDIGHALLTTNPANPTPLRAALSVLAAVALGWLDTLTPHNTVEQAYDSPDEPDTVTH